MRTTHSGCPENIPKAIFLRYFIRSHVFLRFLEKQLSISSLLSYLMKNFPSEPSSQSSSNTKIHKTPSGRYKICFRIPFEPKILPKPKPPSKKGGFGSTHRTKHNFVYCLQQAGFFVRIPALGDLWQEPLLRSFDAVFLVWFIGCFLSVVHSRISDGKKFYLKKCLKLKKNKTSVSSPMHGHHTHRKKPQHFRKQIPRV